MDALTQRLFTVCWCVFASAVTPQGQTEIEAFAGQDVLLPCHSPRNDITLLEWIRPDLKPDGYVFFYRERRSYESYQHPYFRGRVKLGDSRMIDGNMSIILTNAQPDKDDGTYQCCVSVGSTGSSRTASSEIKQVIMLKVSPAKPGHREKHTGDGGAKGGGDKDGGAKDGGAKDGGAKDGGEKDGGDKDGGAKGGGDMDGFSRRRNGLIVCLSLTVMTFVVFVVIKKKPVLIWKERMKLSKRKKKNSEPPDEEVTPDVMKQRHESLSESAADKPQVL